MAEEWNHNVHYHRWVLEQVPAACARALDVGCGDGILCAKLADRCSQVVGIDQSSEMIALASSRLAGRSNVTLLDGDFIHHPLPMSSFDFIVAVAALHHLPFDSAIDRAVNLLRPGGTLAIVGLARIAAPGAWGFSPVDYLWIPPSLLFDRIQHLRHGSWDPGAPVHDPDLTFGEIKKRAHELLPRARIARRLLFRYTLFWRKPDSPPD